MKASLLIHRSGFASILGLALTSFAACGDSGGDDGDGPPGGPTTVAIKADAELQLVMVREGAQGQWRAAQKLTPTTFAAEVHQVYTVLAVCPEANGANVSVFSYALDDEPEIEVVCLPRPDTFAVTGTMVQPGFATLDGVRATGAQANWPFEFHVGAGSYDLIAVTPERVGVQRGIAVSADLALPTPVDVVQQGAALVDTDFTITNPNAGERTEVGVFMVTPHNQPQARIYLGALGGAKVVPTSVLVADEKQEVSVRSYNEVGALKVMHSSRRPFRAGDSAAFTLWDPFTQFRFVADSGALSATWASRSEVSYLFFFLNGEVGSSHFFATSQKYLEASPTTSTSLDLRSVPGYKAEWAVDLTKEYTREMNVDLRTNGISGVTFTEHVNLPVISANGETAGAASRARPESPLTAPY